MKMEIGRYVMCQILNLHFRAGNKILFLRATFKPDLVRIIEGYYVILEGYFVSFGG